MSGEAHYPPVTVPGTNHALRHLPFVPASLRGEFHALAAFHLEQVETQELAEMMLYTYAIQEGWGVIDHLVVWKFLRRMTRNEHT